MAWWVRAGIGRHCRAASCSRIGTRMAAVSASQCIECGVTSQTSSERPARCTRMAAERSRVCSACWLGAEMDGGCVSNSAAVVGGVAIALCRMSASATAKVAVTRSSHAATAWTVRAAGMAFAMMSSACIFVGEDEIASSEPQNLSEVLAPPLRSFGRACVERALSSDARGACTRLLTRRARANVHPPSPSLTESSPPHQTSVLAPGLRTYRSAVHEIHLHLLSLLLSPLSAVRYVVDHAVRVYSALASTTTDVPGVCLYSP